LTLRGARRARPQNKRHPGQTKQNKTQIPKKKIKKIIGLLPVRCSQSPPSEPVPSPLHPEHAVASGAKRLTFVCDFTQNLHNVQLPKGSQGSTAVASGAKRLTFVFAFTQTNLGDGFSSAYRRALPTGCGFSAPGLQRSSYQRRCVIGCAFKQGLPNGQMLRYSQSHFLRRRLHQSRQNVRLPAISSG
jgi:hypothetical protein